MSNRSFRAFETKARELAGKALSENLPHDFSQWAELVDNRFLDSLPVGVAILNEELVLCGQNRTYADYLDQYSPVSANRAMGQCYFDYLPGSYNWVGEVFREAKLTGSAQTTYNHEVRVEIGAGQRVTFWDATLQPLRGPAGRLKGMGLFCLDITSQTMMAETLENLERELESLDGRLNQARSAVGFMAEMKDREQARLEEVMTFNANELARPLLQKLKNSPLTEEQLNIVKLLETTLGGIVSDFAFRLDSPAWGLTGKELMVARLIRDGLPTRKIAEQLNLAPSTIEFHRHNLRRKLKIAKKKVNLQVFLRSLPVGSGPGR